MAVDQQHLLALGIGHVAVDGERILGLAQQALQLTLQLLVALYLADDASLLVDEVFGGQVVDGIFVADVVGVVDALRALRMVPLQAAQHVVEALARQLVLFDGFAPGFLVTVVVGDIDHLQSFDAIFLIDFQHVRVGGAAGLAPRSPEVGNHHMSLQARHGERLAVDVVSGEVGSLFAGLYALEGCQLFHNLLAVAILLHVVAQTVVHLFQLLIAHAAHRVAQELWGEIRVGVRLDEVVAGLGGNPCVRLHLRSQCLALLLVIGLVVGIVQLLQFLVGLGRLSIQGILLFLSLSAMEDSAMEIVGVDVGRHLGGLQRELGIVGVAPFQPSHVEQGTRIGTVHESSEGELAFFHRGAVERELLEGAVAQVYLLTVGIADGSFQGVFTLGKRGCTAAQHADCANDHREFCLHHIHY